MCRKVIREEKFSYALWIWTLRDKCQCEKVTNEEICQGNHHPQHLNIQPLPIIKHFRIAVYAILKEICTFYRLMDQGPMGIMHAFYVVFVIFYVCHLCNPTNENGMRTDKSWHLVLLNQKLALLGPLTSC